MSRNQLISITELRKHCKAGDLWLVVDGKVLDVSAFSSHSGGYQCLLSLGGRDATAAFTDQNHNARAKRLLSQYQIGYLLPSPTIAEEEIDQS